MKIEFIVIDFENTQHLYTNYRSISFCPPTFVMAAIYFIIIFEASVLPLPDSPDIMMHVSRVRCLIARYAASAIANICGVFSYNSRPAKMKRKII